MSDREIDEKQARLGRLLQIPDFRSLIGEWLDGGAAPWTGPVSADTAHEVSYLNGKAAFVAQLEEELREFYPSEFNKMKEERFHGRRRAS